jgi:hypothetical protein
MSSDPDRISVPTNGKRPHSVPTMTTPPAGQDAPDVGVTADAATATATKDAPAGTRSASPDLPGGLSPQQLAVGFGIIASLVLLALGRSRRRPGR